MSQVSTIQTNQLPRNQGSGVLGQLLCGTLGKLACKCSAKNDVDFLIKKDKIVCACCGHEVSCLPPLLGVYVATCNCCASASVKSTFVLDSRGIYTCTWCGRAR
jgi:hypothetical protein